MQAALTVEQRFQRTPDGRVWTPGAFSYDFWQRYRQTFDPLRIIARVKDVEDVPENWKVSSGEGVEFFALPHYIGPKAYLFNTPKLMKAMSEAIPKDAAVLMRIPSPLSLLAYLILKKRRQPYGLQVVGDPREVITAGSVDHPLRPLIREGLIRGQKKLCKDAAACAYVTQEALQRHYPPNGSAHSAAYSDVYLPECYFSSARRFGKRKSKPWQLVAVGTMDQLYKGFDIIIDALPQIKSNVHVTLVGDGQFREQLEAQAEQLGVSEQLTFTGHLAGAEKVRDELDKADVMLNPSRGEGLPRALIEAMARGLPGIGTDVSGIPELLSQTELVPPNDASSLATKIDELLLDPKRLTMLSKRAIEVATHFRHDKMAPRRTAFYQALKNSY